MQQTLQKYVQQEQKQSIVNVCLKENQRHVFSTANERHKTHKTVLKCVRSFSIYTLLFILVSSHLFAQKQGSGATVRG